MDPITIRPYEPRDRDALEALAAEVVREGTVFPFEVPAGVLDYWFAPAGAVFVACAGGEVAGTYVVKPNHPGRGAHVANAGYLVAEAHRGRGVGELLGRHSLEAARELGYRAMQFNQVVSTNTAAVRLWERLGFRRVGELPGAFRHPERGFVATYLYFMEL